MANHPGRVPRHIVQELLKHAFETREKVFLQPRALSGGKHMNAFLCQLEGYSFVLKILPFVGTSRTKLPQFPSEATEIQPASLECLLYEKMNQWSDTQEFIHAPYCYASFLLKGDVLSDMIGWSAKQEENFKDWIKKQKTNMFLCLCLEYTPLTSVRAWFQRFCETKLDSKRLRELSIPSWISEVTSCELGTMEYWNVIFRSIFFQVMFALVKLERLIPGFRHFDLHFGNVLLSPVKSEKPIYMKYTHMVDGKKHEFFVPLLFVVQIFDFDFSFSQTLRNTKVTQSQPKLRQLHGIGPDTGSQYDSHLFLTAFQHCRHLHTDVLQFLDDAVPKGFRVDEAFTCHIATPKDPKKKKGKSFRIQYKHHRKVPTPETLLRHDFFLDLMETPPFGSMIIGAMTA